MIGFAPGALWGYNTGPLLHLSLSLDSMVVSIRFYTTEGMDGVHVCNAGSQATI